MAPPYDLFIFDLDGTLSDPAEGIGNCFNHALSGYGYPTIDQARIAGCIGPPLDYSFRELTGSDDQEHIAALVARYRERYAESGYAENVLYPGIAESLQALQAAGVACGVCTSKRADFAADILELFGIRHYFRFLSGGDVGIPKGEQLQALLEAGDIGPGALMIGDRRFDIEAARQVNIASVGVLWGYGSREELEEAGTRHLVESPAELLQLA